MFQSKNLLNMFLLLWVSIWSNFGTSEQTPTIIFEIEDRGKNRIELTVKNDSTISIGLIRFTLENLDESGEFSLENLRSKAKKSLHITKHSKDLFKVRNVVVVDQKAVTRKARIKITRR